MLFDGGSGMTRTVSETDLAPWRFRADLNVVSDDGHVLVQGDANVGVLSPSGTTGSAVTPFGIDSSTVAISADGTELLELEYFFIAEPTTDGPGGARTYLVTTTSRSLVAELNVEFDCFGSLVTAARSVVATQTNCS